MPRPQQMRQREVRQDRVWKCGTRVVIGCRDGGEQAAGKARRQTASDAALLFDHLNSGFADRMGDMLAAGELRCVEMKFHEPGSSDSAVFFGSRTVSSSAPPASQNRMIVDMPARWLSKISVPTANRIGPRKAIDLPVRA